MGRSRGHKHGVSSKKPPLTHFLCLPLVTPDSRPKLEQTLQTFKEDVCSLALEHGDQAVVRPKAIRPIGTLHFTLAVMSLKEDMLPKAIDHLQKLDLVALISRAETGPTESAPSTGLTISLRGLESMHAPEKTSILYVAPFDATNRLYSFCSALRKSFSDEGFLIEDDRELKLHATIVNTIYAKGRPKTSHKAVTILPNGQVVSSQSSDASEDRSAGHGPNANAPLKLDARRIIEKYSKYVWADNVLLDRVAICEMGAKKITNAAGETTDERYTEICSIALPA